MDQSIEVGVATTERHHERVDHELGVKMRADRPTDQAPMAEVAHAATCSLPSSLGRLGDVSDPLVRTLGGEVPLDRIRYRGDVGASATRLLSVNTQQPVLAHKRATHLQTSRCPRRRTWPYTQAAPQVQRGSRWILQISTSRSASATARGDEPVQLLAFGFDQPVRISRPPLRVAILRDSLRHRVVTDLERPRHLAPRRPDDFTSSTASRRSPADAPSRPPSSGLTPESTCSRPRLFL